MLKTTNKIKSAFLSWVADIRIYPGGIIWFGDSHYHLKGKDVREILNVIEPGDVLLRKYSHYLGSITIPGYWSHAAVYVGDNQVIHMLGEGILKEDILTFTRCDNMIILRCPDKNIVIEAIKKAYYYLAEGIKYDYNFKTNNKKFYCTELPVKCYENYNGIAALLNKKYILPDDLLSKFLVRWQKAENK